MSAGAGAGRPLRLGVFGGTFDPIHNGHLAVAVNARHGVGLDQVLLVVANQPWQKADQRVSPAADRLAMVHAAVAGVEGLSASDVEIRRGGRSYTADTLAELAAAHPGAELFLIVGADVAPILGSWERVEEVEALATLVVVDRPGAGPAVTPPGWAQVRTVEVPALDISSTDLRARAADGRPLDFLVPPAAIRCIRERGLYAGGNP
ncbi:MAG: nicotinate-nucleotide adenylyltransferase [Acidimicrobiales bacterium]